MRYADAREHIRTGDLIAVRSRHGFLPTLTRWVTRSPYTHTAIAVWCGDADGRRLLVAESNGGGCSLSPLSHYQGEDFDVYLCPVPTTDVVRNLWALLGVRIAYDFVDLLRVGANKLLGLPLPRRDEDGLICSALSATIYLHAGWMPIDLPSIPAPSDVVAALGHGPWIRVRND
jgi:hypothetical protein